MAEKNAVPSRSQTANNLTGKRRDHEASLQQSKLVDSSNATPPSCAHPSPEHVLKRNPLNSSSSTAKKPKLSTKNTTKPLKRKPQLHQEISSKKPNAQRTDLPLKSRTSPRQKAQALTEFKDLGANQGNPNKSKQTNPRRSRPLSTEFSVSPPSPPVLVSLHHSWHGMPAGLRTSHRNANPRSNPQRQKKAKLVQKGKSIKLISSTRFFVKNAQHVHLTSKIVWHWPLVRIRK